MGHVQRQKHCRNCSRKTLHIKSEPRKVGCLAHLVLTVCTLGIWLVFAPLVVGLEMFSAMGAPYHCQACGKKRR